jgi:hypothetical protein
MTTLIKHHAVTCDLALFESEGQYWVGSYSPFLTHQNGEPPYVLLSGYYQTEEDGLQALSALRGDEF